MTTDLGRVSLGLLCSVALLLFVLYGQVEVLTSNEKWCGEEEQRNQ